MEMVVKAARDSQDDYYDMQFLEASLSRLPHAHHTFVLSALLIIIAKCQHQSAVGHMLPPEGPSTLAGGESCSLHMLPSAACCG